MNQITQDIPTDRPLMLRSTLGSFRGSAARILGPFLAMLLLSCLVSPSMAATIDGFLMPYRLVNVASSETGIVEVVEVREGAHVTSDQPLARLNSGVQAALLRIADMHMKAKGRLEAAQSEQRMRKIRLDKLSELDKLGHAHQFELERTRSEWEMAKAQVLAAKEEQVIRALEYEKIKLQLDRRTIRSPLDGVVTHILKEEGEFIAPNDPNLMIVAQLDRLIAKFSLMPAQAKTFKVDQEVRIDCPATGHKTKGVVEFLSPIIIADSDTVVIKIRIDNSNGKLRSGERCTIKVPDL